MYVASTAGCNAGQDVVIGQNSAAEEVVQLLQLGSMATRRLANVSFSLLVFAKPLAYAHPAGTIVVAVGPVPPPPVAATTPAVASDPCAAAPVVKLFDGKKGKTIQTSPFTMVNIGMLGFSALCVAGVVFVAKKRSASTVAYTLVGSQARALKDMESCPPKLLFEAPLE